MKELIGWECCCVFNLPSIEWPIAGYPAWVVVDDVDMPMVKMRSRHGGEAMWLNASIIKTISKERREVKPRKPLLRFRPWGKGLGW